MKIEHREIKKKGEFYIEENGKRLAELAYLKAGTDKINIYHTEVDESLRGKGVGADLVKAAMDMARSNDLKVVASCPYARKLIDRTREFEDLLVDE